MRHQERQERERQEGVEGEKEQESEGQQRGVYEERPVSVRRFVTAPEYLGLAGDVYPKILETLSRLFRGQYQEAVFCWGIGSGKSYLCALALLYMTYRTLCLRDPQGYYGLAAETPIHLVSVGPTARVAEKAVYGLIRGMVARSPWFREKYPVDGRLKRELHFPKQVEIVPGNSSELFPLGLNVLGATMDEAAFFVETPTGEQEAAEEVYLALLRRIQSRFGERGLIILASSPRHEEDFIMRKLREAEREPSIFASHKATWEIKPGYGRRRIQIGELSVPAELASAFRRNPQKARRDLAARPSGAYEPFFADLRPLEEACVGEEGLRHPFEEEGRIADWFWPHDRAERYIHIDLGLRRDACGFAMAKIVSEGGRPIAVVEAMWRISAPPGGEINFARLREIVLALKQRGFPIAQVSYDGWQSADSQQILRRQGLHVKTVSVDRDLSAYETLKELAYEGRLRLYRYEPFIQECRRLELVRGEKVDHPPHGSKDVADAVAAAVSEAIKAWGERTVKGRIV